MVLLAASWLSASPCAASQDDVEERLARLERLVEGLVARLDGQQGQIDASQAEAIVAAQKLLAETRASEVRPAAVAAPVAVAPKQDDTGTRVGSTTFAYSGYVKMDAIQQRTSGGQLPNNSFVRDFLVPGAIPVGGPASNWGLDFSARQSRLILATATNIGAEHALKSHIELDFMVTEGGDQRVSNSYVPRMRQAFLTYDKWMFGQAWSTFQNVGALPDSLDFIGTTPGTVFVRQPMVRYTNGPWQLAVEQPETTVTTRTGGRLVAGRDALPDMVARYNKSGPWGTISAAGVLRTLRISNDDLGTGSDTALGYGISLSGKLILGKTDDFRFMATAGRGLGRYIGINIVNDAALDRDGRLTPIATYSGFAAYRHFWRSNLRSSIAASFFKADNPVALTGNQVTDESWNALANLIWSPVKPLDIGVEYMYANRSREDGQSGNLQKVQFSTKYAF
jgi:hypothetical protein